VEGEGRNTERNKATETGREENKKESSKTRSWRVTHKKVCNKGRREAGLGERKKGGGGGACGAGNGQAIRKEVKRDAKWKLYH